MRVGIIGSGEACDPLHANCSALVMTGSDQTPFTLLLDCGFTAASAFLRHAPQWISPVSLDSIWISHFHGDHFFGLPQLLLHFWEQGRTAPLYLASHIPPDDLELRFKTIIDLAYPGLRHKFDFAVLPIQVPACTTAQDITESKGIDLGPLRLRCAPSIHGQDNMSLRVEYAGTAVFYSGDGQATEITAALAAGCNLIMHESFSLETDTPKHGTIPASIELAHAAGASQLALMHIRRDIRQQSKVIEQLMQAAMQRVPHCAILLPEDGDLIKI